MRVIVPVTLILLLALLQLLVQLNVVVLPVEELGLYVSGAILFVGAWLLFAAVNLAKVYRQARERMLALEGAEGKIRQLESELHSRNQALAAGSSETQELKKALQEANRRTEIIEKEARESAKGTQEVLNFLGILQAKGRFIDFLMDDVAKYPDAQVGAAARVVHQGCAGVIREYFDIKPVYDQREGSAVTLDKDYDAEGFRLLGKVMGEPPFKGKLLHHGWRTTSIRLPKPIHVTKEKTRGVIAPAEVEIH